MDIQDTQNTRMSQWLVLKGSEEQLAPGSRCHASVMKILHLTGSECFSEPMTQYYIFILFSCQFYTDLTLLTYPLPLNGLFQIHIKVDETEVSASWGWLLIHC